MEPDDISNLLRIDHGKGGKQILFTSACLDTLRAVFNSLVGLSGKGYLELDQLSRFYQLTAQQQISRFEFEQVINLVEEEGSNGVSFNGFVRLYRLMYAEEGAVEGDGILWKDLCALGFSQYLIRNHSNNDQNSLDDTKGQTGESAPSQSHNPEASGQSSAFHAPDTTIKSIESRKRNAFELLGENLGSRPVKMKPRRSLSSSAGKNSRAKHGSKLFSILKTTKNLMMPTQSRSTAASPLNRDPTKSFPISTTTQEIQQSPQIDNRMTIPESKEHTNSSNKTSESNTDLKYDRRWFLPYFPVQCLPASGRQSTREEKRDDLQSFSSVMHNSRDTHNLDLNSLVYEYPIRHNDSSQNLSVGPLGFKFNAKFHGFETNSGLEKFIRNQLTHKPFFDENIPDEVVKLFLDLAVDSSSADKLWTEKYRAAWCEILLIKEKQESRNCATSLQDWLEQWKSYSSSNAYYDGCFDEMSRDSSFSDVAGSAKPSALFVSCFPDGIGKTSTVYHCANLFGFEVIEAHPGQQRSRIALEQYIGEATQSQVIGKSSNTLGRPLILIDEGDIFFEEQDVGFFTWMKQLISKARSPVVLTCNTITNDLRKALDTIDGIEVTVFKHIPPSLSTVVNILRGVAACEGIEINRNTLQDIASHFGSDFRKCINFFQFVALGSGHRVPHSNRDMGLRPGPSAYDSLESIADLGLTEEEKLNYITEREYCSVSAISDKSVQVSPASPLVKNVLPHNGSLYGGEMIKIFGINFTPYCVVYIDGQMCPNTRFVSDTLLEATTPPWRLGGSVHSRLYLGKRQKDVKLLQKADFSVVENYESGSERPGPTDCTEVEYSQVCPKDSTPISYPEFWPVSVKAINFETRNYTSSPDCRYDSFDKYFEYSSALSSSSVADFTERICFERLQKKRFLSSAPHVHGEDRDDLERFFSLHDDISVLASLSFGRRFCFSSNRELPILGEMDTVEDMSLHPCGFDVTAALKTELRELIGRVYHKVPVGGNKLLNQRTNSRVNLDLTSQKHKWLSIAREVLESNVSMFLRGPSLETVSAATSKRLHPCFLDLIPYLSGLLRPEHCFEKHTRRSPRFNSNSVSSKHPENAALTALSKLHYYDV